MVKTPYTQPSSPFRKNPPCHPHVSRSEGVLTRASVRVGVEGTSCSENLTSPAEQRENLGSFGLLRSVLSYLSTAQLPFKRPKYHQDRVYKALNRGPLGVLGAWPCFDLLGSEWILVSFMTSDTKDPTLPPRSRLFTLRPGQLPMMLPPPQPGNAWPFLL